MADRQDGHQVWPSRPGPFDSPTLPSPSIAILDVMWENGSVTSWKRPPLGGELSSEPWTWATALGPVSHNVSLS